MEGDAGAGVGRLCHWMGSSRYKCCGALSSGGFVVRHRDLCRAADFSIFFFLSAVFFKLSGSSVPKAVVHHRRQWVESSHLRSLSLRRERGNSHNLFLRTSACGCTCEPKGNAGLREAMRPPPPPARIPKTFPSDQRVDPNPVALRCLVLPESGAGDGNRTHTGSASEPLKCAVWCNCGFHV
jgi:hypothetical protein